MKHRPGDGSSFLSTTNIENLKIYSMGMKTMAKGKQALTNQRLYYDIRLLCQISDII